MKVAQICLTAKVEAPQVTPPRFPNPLISLVLDWWRRQGPRLRPSG
jgi:hypothetical protein